MSSIKVENYDPKWPGYFEEIRGPIAAALDGLVLAIEHVGSTAVPGLAAKPIIDLDAQLKNWADFPDVVNRLRPLGYHHQGNLGIAGREAFSWPETVFLHYLYVCSPDSDEYHRHLAFRDYLRAHPDAVAEYGALKQELAQKVGSDREEYTRGKSHFVLDILSKASKK